MTPIISKQRLTSSVTTVIAVMSASLLGACNAIEGRWSATNYGYNDIRVSGTSGLERQTTSILPPPQAARTGISHPAAFLLTATGAPALVPALAPSSSGPAVVRMGALTPSAPRSITAPETAPMSKTNFRPSTGIVSRSVGDITTPHLATQNVPVLQKPTLAPTDSSGQTQSAAPSLLESIGGSVLELFDLLNVNQYDMSSPALNNQRSNIRGSLGYHPPFRQ